MASANPGKSQPYNADDHANRPADSETDPGASQLSPGEVLFWAPIGLALKGATALPSLVEDGLSEYRKRAQVAKFMGKMIVGQQQRKRRAAAAAKATRTGPKGPARTPDTRIPDTSIPDIPAPVSVTQPTDLGTAVTQPTAPGRPVPLVAQLPIDGYDTLPARSLVALLDGLSPTELQLIRDYEQANRHRMTILNAVAQRLAA
jgi:hypothetical protein